MFECLGADRLVCVVSVGLCVWVCWRKECGFSGAQSVPPPPTHTDFISVFISMYVCVRVVCVSGRHVESNQIRRGVQLFRQGRLLPSLLTLLGLACEPLCVCASVCVCVYVCVCVFPLEKGSVPIKSV